LTSSLHLDIGIDSYPFVPDPESYLNPGSVAWQESNAEPPGGSCTV